MDTYSLDIATILTLLVSGGSMLFIARSHRQAPGFTSTGWGLTLTGLGLIVVIARLIIPGKLIIAASDVVLFAGAAYLANGLRKFCGLPKFGARVIGPAAAIFGSGVVYWLYITDRQPMRVALASALFAAVTTLGAIATLRMARIEDRAVYGLVSFGLFANAVFLVGRMAYAMGHPVMRGVMGDGPVESAHLVTLNVGVILCGFGLLTASNQRLKREVEALALYDPLTQLPNRRFFEERFTQAGKRASRTGERIALIYADLDDFKSLNDSLGHAAGDEVLKIVAERLSAAARESDCVARLGGDEFVVLLEDAPARTVLLETIDRLRTCVSEPFVCAGHEISVTISCGLSVFPEDAREVAELVRGADLAMYAEKRSRGR